MNNISKAAALMGRKGGNRRAAALTPKRRSEIARMGYKAGIAKRLPVKPAKVRQPGGVRPG